ncbi:MAG: DUF2283 domain-containing protein [Patescibacteria group bacterium]
MKIKYYKEDDLLIIELSKKVFQDAEMEGDFIVHYTKKREPVLIEVLNASKFLKATSKAIPKSTKQQIFA